MMKSVTGNKPLQEKYIDDLRPLISEFTPEKFAQRWRQLINEHLPGISM